MHLDTEIQSIRLSKRISVPSSPDHLNSIFSDNFLVLPSNYGSKHSIFFSFTGELTFVIPFSSRKYKSYHLNKKEDHLGPVTCLQAMKSAVTPRSWKQSAATGVVVRKRSRVFIAKHKDSKEKLKCLCTGISQLISLHRASAVTCEVEEKKGYYAKEGMMKL